MTPADRVLVTERLVLCPATPGDHATLLAHWTAPDVRRFLFDGALLLPAEVTDAIEASTRSFAAAGYGLWLAREREAATGEAEAAAQEVEAAAGERDAAGLVG